MSIIDAHQHYWQLSASWHVWPTPELSPIHHDFMPHDLLPTLVAHDVTGTVLVQSQPSDADTDWMLGLAERTPTILGVVGWIDPLAPETPARIAALARHRKLKGVRAMWQDQPLERLADAAADRAWTAITDNGLVLDALVRPAQLGALATIADRYPEMSIVVDHAAKPDIVAGLDSRWADTMARLAAMPQVACKLSGLVTEAAADWTSSDLAPFVDRVLAGFGSHRLLWGSDWPVSLLRAGYGEWLEAARRMIPHDAHPAVFGETAVRIYHLSIREPEA